MDKVSKLKVKHDDSIFDEVPFSVQTFKMLIRKRRQSAGGRGIIKIFPTLFKKG